MFEDEAAGKVRLPWSSLGRERPIYLGKSVEGVLRHRKVSELTKLFRLGFVCIRRFRSTDHRLLPLVLDPPRLLKYNASPSPLAQQVGLQPPTKQVPPLPIAPDERAETAPAALPAAEGKGERARERDSEGEVKESTSEEAYRGALARGLRLLAVYRDAGGGLCMRHSVWRRLMGVLHPDRGGDMRAFQEVTVLKRLLDEGEAVELPPAPEREGPPSQADVEAEALEAKLREEMRVVGSS